MTGRPQCLTRRRDFPSLLRGGPNHTLGRPAEPEWLERMRSASTVGLVPKDNAGDRKTRRPRDQLQSLPSKEVIEALRRVFDFVDGTADSIFGEAIRASSRRDKDEGRNSVKGLV